jgi:hypothetical protein
VLLLDLHSNQADTPHQISSLQQETQQKHHLNDTTAVSKQQVEGIQGIFITSAWT